MKSYVGSFLLLRNPKVSVKEMNMDSEKIFVTRSSMPPYEEYIEAIKPLWDSHWLTNMGVYHQQLEKELAEYLDVPQISLTVNGHMALELAIQSFDFPEGSEIITTPFTFISTTHAIVRNRLNPVFCDIKESDGTIDESKIESLITEKTVAILPVHVYGNICNVEEIQRIADKYNLKVIYDAAHAFGEKYKGVGVGNFGDVSVFSFHATKVYNTIEGGAVVCKSQEKYERLRDLKNFGIRNEELVASVGANAKMNEFCAIMGLLNLKYVERTITDRKERFEFYMEKLSDNEGIMFFCKNAYVQANYAYFPILISEKARTNRDGVYDALKKNGYHARKYFYPITADQACFKNKYKNTELSIARRVANQILLLPFYDTLEVKTMKEITEMLSGIV